MNDELPLSVAPDPPAAIPVDDDLPALLGGRPVRPAGPPVWPLADPDVAAALRTVYESGDWSRYHGPTCHALSERIAARTGCAHVVLCSSGTFAVELALRGIPVQAGDEVVLAGYDFKGNIADVLALGALPVLVDVDPVSGTLDVRGLAAAFTPSTMAVLVSHLHGGVASLPAIVETAKARGVPVIEDACQMPGARIHGREAGTWGQVGVWSFGGSKLLGAGRGGALFTNDADVAQRIRLFTQRGNDLCPLSELQAAVLLPQCDKLDERNALRAGRAKRLCAKLADLPGLRPFGTPEHDRTHPETSALVPHDTLPGFYKLGFRYDAQHWAGLPRELFVRAARAEGIALDLGFRALHLTHGRRRFRAADDLKQATLLDAQVVVLHHPVLLGEESDLGQIAAALHRIRRHAAAIRTHAPPANC